MKRTVSVSVFLLGFVYAASFAADFEDKLILPDFTDERFVLLGNRAPFGYCNDDQSQQVFIEIYLESNSDGSQENAIVAFLKAQ